MGEEFDGIGAAGAAGGADGIVELDRGVMAGKCAELISPIPTKKSSNHIDDSNVTCCVEV